MMFAGGVGLVKRRSGEVLGFRSGGVVGELQGPVSGDETPVPADDRRRLHDQEHFGEAAAVDHGGEHREDRPVRLGELCSVDLTLQHQDPVTEGEDLGVAMITGSEEPSEPGENESCEGSEQDP